MKHEKYVQYTLYTDQFSDVAHSRAAARRKAKGWTDSGFELTRVDKAIREVGSDKVISQVCCYTVKELV